MFTLNGAQKRRVAPVSLVFGCGRPSEPGRPRQRSGVGVGGGASQIKKRGGEGKAAGRFQVLPGSERAGGKSDLIWVFARTFARPPVVQIDLSHSLSLPSLMSSSARGDGVPGRKYAHVPLPSPRGYYEPETHSGFSQFWAKGQSKEARCTT